MKHKTRDYIDSIIVSHGTCINTEEYGEINWKGYSFSIRDNLDEYESVEDWVEQCGNTIKYCYRDFNETGCSPDIIRAEFSLWSGDYSGTELSNIMIKLENVIYLYEVTNKIFENQPLTKLETITNYVYLNAYRFVKKTQI